jgi:hypothetical protein
VVRRAERLEGSGDLGKRLFGCGEIAAALGGASILSFNMVATSGRLTSTPAPAPFPTNCSQCFFVLSFPQI